MKTYPTTRPFYIFFGTVLLLMIHGCQAPSVYEEAAKQEAKQEKEQPLKASLRPSPQNPAYWQYKGENVLLLGGSDEDNLFQMPKAQLDEQLAALQTSRGNYVRCTMSSRDPGNLWPFHLQEDGIYDLNQWNEEYWNRLAYFLDQTEQKDIIVQMEIWATFDFYRDNWEVNPFNPKNNRNYTPERTDLPLAVPTHPVFTDNPFFWSVPSQQSNLALLNYQQKFVDKLLEISLPHGNVLYCMDNETSVTAEWGKFWSFYIQKVAEENGNKVFTTEMWDPWDLSHAAHRETLDHPEIYGFADISQNNHNTGQVHWDNGLEQVEKIARSEKMRPLNNVKIYGNDGGRHQTTKNAIESFVRNVFFGAASARFHRPTSGQGLNPLAQRTIKSLRELTDAMDFFNGAPLQGSLSGREENEAYARGIKGQELAVYFTDGGDVQADLSGINNPAVRWVDVRENQWTEVKALSGNTLTCPSQGDWIALVIGKDDF